MRDGARFVSLTRALSALVMLAAFSPRRFRKKAPLGEMDGAIDPSRTDTPHPLPLRSIHRDIKCHRHQSHNEVAQCYRAIPGMDFLDTHFSVETLMSSLPRLDRESGL